MQSSGGNQCPFPPSGPSSCLTTVRGCPQHHVRWRVYSPSVMLCPHGGVVFSIKESLTLSQRVALHLPWVQVWSCLTVGAGELDSGDAYNSKWESPSHGPWDPWWPVPRVETHSTPLMMVFSWDSVSHQDWPSGGPRTHLSPNSRASDWNSQGLILYWGPVRNPWFSMRVQGNTMRVGSAQLAEEHHCIEKTKRYCEDWQANSPRRGWGSTGSEREQVLRFRASQQTDSSGVLPPQHSLFPLLSLCPSPFPPLPLQFLSRPPSSSSFWAPPQILALAQPLPSCATWLTHFSSLGLFSSFMNWKPHTHTRVHTHVPHPWWISDVLFILLTFTVLWPFRNPQPSQRVRGHLTGRWMKPP